MGHVRCAAETPGLISFGEPQSHTQQFCDTTHTAVSGVHQDHHFKTTVQVWVKMLMWVYLLISYLKILHHLSVPSLPAAQRTVCVENSW